MTGIGLRLQCILQLESEVASSVEPGVPGPVEAPGVTSPIEKLELRLRQVTEERDTIRGLYLRALETIRKLELGIVQPKTERLPNDAQLTIEILSLVLAGTPHAEGEVPQPGSAEMDGQHPELAEGAPSRKDRPPPTGRKNKPRQLPRVEVEVTPPEVLLEGLAAFSRIGEDKCEVTERRRGGSVVVLYRRPKFVRKEQPGQGITPVVSGAEVHHQGSAHDEGNSETRPLASPVDPGEEGPDESTEVLVAPSPDLPIERGSAGPALLAETIVRRWLDAIPLYRMAKMYAREGLPLARSTICGWHETLGELVAPLIAAMHRDALKEPVLCTDATGVRVQAKDKCVQGHFFVVIAPLLHVLFFYSKNHDSEAVDAIFHGYRGALVADAHSIYDHLYRDGSIVEVADWAHVRRYFHKAHATDPERAKHGLGRIAALFRIERELSDMTPEDRLRSRLRRSKPIVDGFFEWLSAQALAVVQYSPIHAAVRYALNQKVALTRFLEDGRRPLHNNWSEGQLRREAVGRKNWMFLGTHDSGHTNARFMSLLASSELHGLDPQEYIRDLLCLLPTWPASKVLDLAPSYWKKTLEQTDAQKILDANVFRRISLGLDPFPSQHPHGE